MSDPDLKDLLPEPFLTVRLGDQVTVFLKRTVTREMREKLEEVLPADVDWVLIGDSPFAGVVHVARGDSPLPPAPPEPEWVDNKKVWR